MNSNNLIDRLDDFFDLSKKKQRKKHDKLLDIINTLQNKKSKLRRDLKKESKNCKNSDACKKLCREFKVVAKLLKKAKKHAESG